MARPMTASPKHRSRFKLPNLSICLPSSCFSDDRLGLHLDLVAADELRFDERVGRTDVPEHAAVHARYLFPAAEVLQVDPGSYDVLQDPAERLYARPDLVE